MNGPRVLAHLVRADFRERVRRSSFLVTLGLMLVLAYAYVPARDAWYITLSVDGARGVYNSAWVGSLVAILTSLVLALVGFYLVKDAVARDEQTGVGQIIATTPLRRPLYTLGKWFSHLLVLALMVGVTAVAAGAMQLVLGEDRRLDLPALLIPFVWIVLPTLALVASLAVLFETVGWLRGGLGNVVYFFLCTAVAMGALMPVMITAGATGTPPALDVFGIGGPLSRMLRAPLAALPTLDAGNNSIGPVPVSVYDRIQTFAWAGMEWTPETIAPRLLLVGLAFGLALLAAVPFGRFDPARERRRRPSMVRPSDASAGPPQWGRDEVAWEAADPTVDAAHPPPRLTRLAPAAPRFGFGRMLLAELRLIRKGLPWWWSLVAIGLVVAGLVSPSDVARQYVLPAAWLWPILAWSGLGAREARHGTGQLVFSAAHPLTRQLPATWLAGVLMTALAGSGVAVNLVRAGEGGGLVAWAVAALFIPTLAVALATWSGGGKLFEVVYLVLWYGGTRVGLRPLDFMDSAGDAVVAGTPLVYAVATLALAGVAVTGRRRQVQT